MSVMLVTRPVESWRARSEARPVPVSTSTFTNELTACCTLPLLEEPKVSQNVSSAACACVK